MEHDCTCRQKKSKSFWWKGFGAIMKILIFQLRILDEMKHLDEMRHLDEMKQLDEMKTNQFTKSREIFRFNKYIKKF